MASEDPQTIPSDPLLWIDCLEHRSSGALAGMTVGFTAGIARFTATKLVLCKPEDVWSHLATRVAP